MELWDFVQSGEGRKAARLGFEDGTKHLLPDLNSGILGGTMLAHNIRFVRVSDGALYDFIVDDMVESGVPDPENGAYDYRAIAGGKRDLSTRTRMSARFAIATGLRREDEVKWLGNAIVYMDTEGTIALIVSCSGLADIGDETYAEMIAPHIKHRVLVRWRQMLALAA